jgi:plastocyanin domain-containing protein
MDAAEWGVVVGGVILVGAILWYFFGEREAVRAEGEAGGVQQIRITVRGGYSPDVVVVRQGRPVRLDFFRDETTSCSEQVVFPDFGIARGLPAHRTTPVEFTPEEAGEFTWTCGMRMLRGKLVVEPA